jgi:hypothetical protein
VSAILNFLSWDPRPVSRNLAGRLLAYRQGRGLLGLLEIVPSTLARWERGERQATRREPKQGSGFGRGEGNCASHF